MLHCFSWLHSDFLMHRRGLITHIFQGWMSGKCMGALDWYQSRTNHDKAPVTILPGNTFINNNHQFPLRIYLVFYSDLDKLVPMQIHTWFRLFKTLGRPIISSRWRQTVIPPWLVTMELTCQGRYHDRPGNCKQMCQDSVVLFSRIFWHRRQ